MADNDLITKADVKALIRSGVATETYSDQDYACALIDDFEPVDAAPVIHAYWIEYYTDIMCSHCHATYKDEIVDMYQDGVDHHRYVGLEYCPHCGSIMDGGDE